MQVLFRSGFDAFGDEIGDLLFFPVVEMGRGDDLEVLVGDRQMLVKCEEVIEGGYIVVRPSDEIDLFAECLQMVALVNQERVGDKKQPIQSLHRRRCLAYYPGAEGITGTDNPPAGVEMLPEMF